MSDKEKTMFEKVWQAIQKAMAVEGNVVYHTFGKYSMGFAYLTVSPSFFEDWFTESKFCTITQITPEYLQPEVLEHRDESLFPNLATSDCYQLEYFSGRKVQIVFDRAWY